MVLTICWRLRTASGFGPAVGKIPVGVSTGEVNPVPTKPVYLFITPTFKVGTPTSIYRHLRFCLGSLRAGVNPAPTMPVYLFVLTQPFTVGPHTSIYRHLRFCLGSLRAGVNPAPTIPCVSIHYQISVGARLVLARLSGLIRRSDGGKPRPYNNARLSGLTASTFFYAYLII